MAGAFISRQEKSSWGIPCNQRSDGELFVGKGYGTTFVSQLPDLATPVGSCLTKIRSNRNGRFWVNKAKGTVTMAVGESSENKYQTAQF
jgi:hypothetical protein